jgi:hypothetical protein
LVCIIIHYVKRKKKICEFLLISAFFFALQKKWAVLPFCFANQGYAQAEQTAPLRSSCKTCVKGAA